MFINIRQLRPKSLLRGGVGSNVLSGGVSMIDLTTTETVILLNLYDAIAHNNPLPPYG